MIHRGPTVLAMDCVLAGAETRRGRPLNSIVRCHRMQRGTFTVDSKLFEVRVGSLGREEYHFNGQLLEKRQSWKWESRRQFDIGTHRVEVVLGVKPNGFPFGRAYVDGELTAPELFSEREWRRPRIWRIAIALCVVLALIGITKLLQG